MSKTDKPAGTFQAPTLREWWDIKGLPPESPIRREVEIRSMVARTMEAQEKRPYRTPLPEIPRN